MTTGDVLGHGRRVERPVVAGPVGVAVPGQVDGHQRAPEGQRHRVPGVGVLTPAVDEDELGRGVPHTRALTCRPGATSTDSADARWAGRSRADRPRPALSLEHRELVVLVGARSSTAS